MEDYKLNWDRVLPYVLLQYRIAIIEKVNASPFMLLYGRKPRVPINLVNIPKDFDLFFIDPIDYISEKMKLLEDYDNEMKRRNEEEFRKTEERNVKLKDPEDLPVGSLVLVRKHKHLLKKFESPYSSEIYTITRNKSQRVYEVLSQKNDKKYTVNRKDLLLWENLKTAKAYLE